jgi:hypothetical protein
MRSDGGALQAARTSEHANGFVHEHHPVEMIGSKPCNGSGYPLGLQGEQILLEARIFAVVDVWDALTSDRPYRPAWPREKVPAHIRAQAGTDFDPEVMRKFLAAGVV